MAADGFRYAKGRLALTEGGDTIATLAFAGHHRQADFQLADDGNGGTDIMLTPASRAPEALSSPAAGPPDFWMARG